MSDNLTLIGIVVTAIGSSASVIGIALVLIQLRSSQRIARGEFLLHLTDQLDNHKEMYQILRDKDWKPSDISGKPEMIEFESYLSVFEQYSILITYGIIDLEVFVRLHGHRLMFILLNEFSYSLLSKHSAGWSDFIVLCQSTVKSMRASKTWSAGTGPRSDKWHDFCDRVDKLKI